jgi:hypothetical protein
LFILGLTEAEPGSTATAAPIKRCFDPNRKGEGEKAPRLLNHKLYDKHLKKKTCKESYFIQKYRLFVDLLGF